MSLADDFEGHQRPCNGAYDIGAYEFQNCPTAGTHEISAQDKPDFILYPNPADDILHIIYNGNPQDHFEMMIHTVQGAVVSKHHNPKNIDISGLADGLYFITLTTGSRQYVQTLVKK